MNADQRRWTNELERQINGRPLICRTGIQGPSSSGPRSSAFSAPVLSTSPRHDHPAFPSPVPVFRQAGPCVLTVAGAWKNFTMRESALGRYQIAE